MVPGVMELWGQAILPYNLPFTLLLGLVVVYWVLTLLGAVGVDSLDTNLDGGGDDAAGNLGDLPSAMLRVVNAGFVPLTVVLSILILMMWLGTITLNYYFNPGQSWLIAAGFLVVSFVFAVIATKILTQPLVPLMRKLKEAENIAPVIGEVGVVRSIEMDSKYGQVEVERPGGAAALLNARLGVGAEPVPRGTPVAIISLDESSGLYLVRALPPVPPID